jgi:anti-sigma regulatory factor (Ser/Thr protein kinase)
VSNPLRILPGEPPSAGAVIFERTMPSRLDLKQEVLDQLSELLVARGLVSEEDRHWLVLCLDEVLVNAMLHGNEGDPALQVAIRACADGSRWTITVADQGEGFSAAQIPDQADPESLLLEHGRGIRLLSEWLDELTYYRGGATALIARRRADLPG